MNERFDLTVLGGGPGGYVAAIRAAQLGLRTALVEREQLGGVCLNWGCIPTKALLSCADLLVAARRADEYGLRIPTVEADIPSMFDRKDAIVERLRGGVAKLLSKRGVSVFQGEGAFVGDGSVEVTRDGATQVLESDKLILALGSEPIVPAAFPYDGRTVVTSREALSLTEIPDSVAVIGAGAVGCEFAWFYSALGVRVTLIEMLPGLVPGEDATASRTLASAFKRSGVDVRTGTRVESVSVDGGRATVATADGEPVECGLVLLAMGRRPSVESAGIGDRGVAIENGAVSVNEHMETSVPGVYAIGDLVGGWMLAHVASREGVVAASRAAGLDVRMDYTAVPRCTFTRPEIASVGATEADLKERGTDFESGRFPFSALGKAVAVGETSGFVKVLSERGSGRVLGGVVVGPHASDLVHEIALATEAGLTHETVASMIHAHPTLSEGVAEAAEAVSGLSIHSL